MKTVLITGSTSGIGLATARKLANEGNYKLIVCGRRKERLAKIVEELSSKVKIISLSFDVRDKQAVKKIIKLHF